jgi:hypothetical protein
MGHTSRELGFVLHSDYSADDEPMPLVFYLWPCMVIGSGDSPSVNGLRGIT